MKKQLGYIGLGKMGFNMVERLLEQQYEIAVYDRNAEMVKNIAAKGAKGAESIGEFVGLLPAPRVVWIMVPHRAVDAVIEEITPLLASGDIIVDGGNSPYKMSMRRAEMLAKRGIQFLDVGVSGGPEGARGGACLMIGGDKRAYAGLEELFQDVAAPNGYKYLGKSGAGHFVKMVHNGIEYGMMEAIAEGFNIMRHSQFALSLNDVADIYQQQSVVTSRLIGWLKKGFAAYGEDLAEVDGSVGASGEGAWTIEAAKELGVDAAGIEHALNARVESQRKPDYAGKLIQTMRNMFGGHVGHTEIVS